MECSLPASSVRGILQARILKCVVIPSSRRSSWPRDWRYIISSAFACRLFTTSVPCEPSRDDGSLKYFKHHLGHEYMVVSKDYCSVVALKIWGHLCISHVWVEEKMPFVSTTVKRWAILCFLEIINYTWINVLFVSANNELCKVDDLQHFCSLWHL